MIPHCFRRAALVAAIAACGAAAQDAKLAKIEALLRKHDANGDAAIARAECKNEDLFRKADEDKNGSVSVPELLKAEGRAFDRLARLRLLGPVPEVRQFAQLVLCDADGDGALDVDELKILVFGACDRGERDKKLDVKEAAASPAPSGSNLKTGWLARDFKRLDLDGDGALLMRELDLPPSFLKALDKNDDGRASFDELVADEIARTGGYVGKYAELAAYFAKNDAAKPADWPAENAAFRRLDENDDGTVVAAEFDRHTRRMREVLALASDFLVRFDLDGDGKVSPPEFGGPPSTFARLDVDKDGFVTAKDAKRK